MSTAAQGSGGAGLSIWDRIRGVRAKKVESALETYRRYLARLEAGEDLKDKEVVEFTDAMDKAGISEADLTAHRQMLDQLARARVAVAEQERLSGEYQAAEARLRDFDAKKLRPLLEQSEAMHAELARLQQALQLKGFEAVQAADLERKRRELFGEHEG